MLNKTLTTAAALAAVSALPAQAAIEYGDYSGDTIDYLDVAEDDQGLFGAPFISGDSLVFTPLDFEALAADGDIDLVDGTFSAILMTTDDAPLVSVELFESGFFTLSGDGGEDTRVIAGLAATVNILEVDGEVFEDNPSTLNFSEILADFNLGDDGENLLTDWSGSFELPIAAAAEEYLGITGNITKAAIVVDNQLLAFSEEGSVSFIDKKSFEIEIVVPEPASLALVAAGAFAMMSRRRVDA
ncbi:MAG: PEP-CTERM sorting domain-containing protein [Planctomycetota bacterium]